MERGSTLLGLRLYYVASFAAFGAYLPYFPRWLEARGVRGASMSAVAALLPAMGVVAPPLFGLIADALGLRASLLRVACLGAALPLLGLGAFAATREPRAEVGFAALFAVVLIFAFFRAPMTMMADVVAIERGRATLDANDVSNAYGKLRLFGSLGFLAAALAVGRAVDVTAPAPLPLFIGIALLAAFGAAIALPSRAPDAARPPAGSAAGGARALLADGRYRLFLAVAFLSQVAHTSYDLCASLHLRDLGANGGFTGAYWAVGVGVEVALMFTAHRLFARARPRTLLAVGVAGATVRWSATAMVGSLPALLALQPLHALSFALVWLSSIAYLKDETPRAVASTAQGVFTAALAIGSVAGMAAWGPLYAASGGRAVFGAAAGVAALALALAIALSRAPPDAEIRPREAQKTRRSPG